MASANDMIVLDGSSFFVSERTGDVDATSAEGFFYEDVRHIAVWQLRIDDQPLHLLTATNPAYFEGRIYGTVTPKGFGDNPPISIRRDRIVARGVHEDVWIENHSEQERKLQVSLRVSSDFADLFEAKDGTKPQGKVRVQHESGSLRLQYERDGYERATVVSFGQTPILEDGKATFNVTLGPRKRWRLCIAITPVVDGEHHEPMVDCPNVGSSETSRADSATERATAWEQRHSQAGRVSLEQWFERAPKLATSLDTLHHVYQQSISDFAALRLRPYKDLEWALPAAGMPWFMSLFGRDTLVAGFQTLPFEPQLARAGLRALAHFQATKDDPFRDAQPGKIVHERRQGTLAHLNLVAQSEIYYGTHDATPLFVVLLDEYHRWSGDDSFVRELEPAARAAMNWIEGLGDRDGDGYLEYLTRSPKGLHNQCWKDSDNSIMFADGRIAERPHATCEIQGYAYDSRVRMARLCRELFDDSAMAERLERDAAELKERFNRDYWIESRGHFALALDKDKRQVDALTSNIGHLLWSGIVADEHVQATVDALMSPKLFSGWGVRTMARGDAGYNPIEYHNGTIWPHDNAFIAEGLRRYGYRDEASRIALGMLDAARCFNYRLPEVFAGFDRDSTGIPVEYPTACSPQAWAAGAPLLAMRTLLGLEPGEHGRLEVAPHFPDEIAELQLTAIPFRGGTVDSHKPVAVAAS